MSKQNQANVCIITISNVSYKKIFDKVNQSLTEKDVMINFVISDSEPDPLKLNKQILLKILLNVHSTAVITLLGRVVGNTMVFVNASNLKLIGRATYLIMTHVNDTITKEYWKKNFGETETITYEEANAVLFDAIEYLKKHPQQIGEVALSIIRILECLKKNSYISYEEAIKIIETEGLESYLLKHNPSLKP